LSSFIRKSHAKNSNDDLKLIVKLESKTSVSVVFKDFFPFYYAEFNVTAVINTETDSATLKEALA